jgi:hypothetical protein
MAFTGTSLLIEVNIPFYTEFLKVGSVELEGDVYWVMGKGDCLSLLA